MYPEVKSINDSHVIFEKLKPRLNDLEITPLLDYFEAHPEESPDNNNIKMSDFFSKENKNDAFIMESASGKIYYMIFMKKSSCKKFMQFREVGTL